MKPVSIALAACWLLILPPSCTHSDVRERREQAIAPDVDMASAYRRLEFAGFHPGPFDRKEYSPFFDAVKRFQGFAGMTPTGMLDAATWTKLRMLYDPEEKRGERLIPVQKQALNLAAYPVAVGDRAYAIESVACSDLSGDWILLYQGRVDAIEEGAVRLRLENRYGYRFHPDQEGVADTDWWCIPKKRHCYAPVAFNGWGGSHRADEVVSFPRHAVFNEKITIINGVSIHLQRACNR